MRKNQKYIELFNADNVDKNNWHVAQFLAVEWLFDIDSKAVRFDHKPQVTD